VVAIFRNGFWRRLWVALVVTSAVGFAVPAWAGGGKPATKLVNVADTRSLPPGLTKLVGDVYNDNLVLFGLMVVVVMASMGLILGVLFDRGLVMLGLDLGKLQHHE
jgi:hypothetical protein